MRFYKFISVLLHPIVMPTIGVLLYFILIPVTVSKQQEYALLSIVFLATYIIPIGLLIVLKALGFIKNFQVSTIKERKTPLLFMVVLFYFLGKTFYTIAIVRDLGYLFYGTVLGLAIVYLFFFINTKVSLHILALGNAIGFFLILSTTYSINILPIITVFIIMAGVLASARLHLKAHTLKEVCLGFLIGIISQITVYYFL